MATWIIFDPTSGSFHPATAEERLESAVMASLAEGEHIVRVIGYSAGLYGLRAAEALAAEQTQAEERAAGEKVSAVALSAVLATHDKSDEEIAAEFAAAKAQALTEIDAEAELVRERFVTSGSAQAMVYLEKRQEAEQVVAADNPEAVSPQLAPHICREAQDTGQAKFDVAIVVLTLAEQWRSISPLIESLRMGAKRAVAEAQTPQEVEAAKSVDWSPVLIHAP